MTSSMSTGSWCSRWYSARAPACFPTAQRQRTWLWYRPEPGALLLASSTPGRVTPDAARSPRPGGRRARRATRPRGSGYDGSGRDRGLEQEIQGRGGVQGVHDHAPPGAGQAGQVRGLLVVVGRGQDDQLGQGAGGRERVVVIGAAAVGQQDDHP